MKMMHGRRRVIVGGSVVELWENPDAPFGCLAEHIQSYLDRRDWLSLFNAIAIAGSPERISLGS
jgi:hypothetical protein